MNTELIIRNVTLAQLGDQAAFSELVRECQQIVYATALEKLRDGGAAQDVPLDAQEREQRALALTGG